MAFDGVGKIYIPLEEFWKFVARFSPGDGSAEIAYSPQIRITESDVEIDYACSTECHPSEWTSPPVWLKKEKSQPKKEPMCTCNSESSSGHASHCDLAETKSASQRSSPQG